MKTESEVRLEEINNELKELAPKIPTEKRMQWAIDNGCSLATVDRYLNGQAKKLVIAMKLLSDMKSNIENSIAA